MEKLVWIDLETTGLNPRVDKILEVGVVVTQGPAFEEIAAKSWVIACTPSQLENWCNDWCKKQHQASGLWEECISKDAKWRTYVEDFVVLNIDGWLGLSSSTEEPEEGAYGPMCGSTISFDRSFLESYCPRLAKRFHYRNLDVSAFRAMMPVLGMMLPAKKGVHRALDDIRESINLARFAADCMQLGYDLAKERYL